MREYGMRRWLRQSDIQDVGTDYLQNEIAKTSMLPKRPLAFAGCAINQPEPCY